MMDKFIGKANYYAMAEVEVEDFAPILHSLVVQLEMKFYLAKDGSMYQTVTLFQGPFTEEKKLHTLRLPTAPGVVEDRTRGNFEHHFKYSLTITSSEMTLKVMRQDGIEQELKVQIHSLDKGPMHATVKGLWSVSFGFNE